MSKKVTFNEKNMNIDNDKIVIDEQTGRVFKVIKEKTPDKIAAIISIVYLLLMALFFLWKLIDIHINKYTLIKMLLGPGVTNDLDLSQFKIIIYCFIGGALGGITKEIRSFIFWHCEKIAFGRQFIWKTLIAPWLGAILAFFVFTIFRSGIALFGAEYTTNKNITREVVSTFALSILSGYGTHKIFIWMDANVSKLFKTFDKSKTSIKVPLLLGKTIEEAEKILDDNNLIIGKISSEKHQNKNYKNKIINQEPATGKTVSMGEKINITIVDGK